MNAKFTSICDALNSVERAIKLNLVSNNLYEGEELLMEFEAVNHMLGLAKNHWEDGKKFWHAHLAKL